LTHTLVDEPYSPVHVQAGALQAVFLLQKPRYVFSGVLPDGTVTSRRGRETHRHDYTRPLAALSDEVGGLSTALGLFASPPMILSTESVVMMKWKGMSGMSTSIATRAASLGMTLEMQGASAESALLGPMSSD